MGKLLSVVDDLDGVDESVRDFYAEENGAYVLQIENFGKHPGVQTLKSAANKLNKDKTELVEKISSYESRFNGLPDDFDANAYAALKDAAEGKGGKPTDEQIAEMRERLKSSLERSYKPEIESRDQKIAKMDASLRRMVIEGGLSKAMDEAAINPDFKDAAMALVLRHVKVDLEETDGNYNAMVDTDLGPMPLGQFVKDWASTDQGRKFVAKSTGPDPKGGRGDGGGRSMRVEDFNLLPAKDRADFMKKGGVLKD